MLRRVNSVKYFVRHFFNFVIDTKCVNFHALTPEISTNKEDQNAVTAARCVCTSQCTVSSESRCVCVM